MPDLPEHLAEELARAQSNGCVGQVLVSKTDLVFTTVEFLGGASPPLPVPDACGRR